MPAQYPHRLARKRDMPSQRTPGQPNSFSAYSVAEHPSAIPSVPQYLFRKNKPKSKMEKLPCPRNITHLPSALSPGVRLPLLPQCLATPIPRPLFEKTNPIDTLQHRLGCRPERVERVEGAPFRLDKYEKQTQSQDRQTSEPAHTYPSSIRDILRRLPSLGASMPRCLDPFSKKRSQYQYRQDATGHQPLDASVPCYADPLAPYPKKHRRSAGGGNPMRKWVKCMQQFSKHGLTAKIARLAPSPPRSETQITRAHAGGTTVCKTEPM